MFHRKFRKYFPNFQNVNYKRIKMYIKVYIEVKCDVIIVLTKLCNTLNRSCGIIFEKLLREPYFFYLLNSFFFFSNGIRFLILRNAVRENGMPCRRTEMENREKLYDSGNFFRLRAPKKRKPLRIFYTHFRRENGLILHHTRYYLARKDTGRARKRYTIASVRVRRNKRGSR